jgi:guanosine-3',5'-bis(diphosphate) 3'-pyrophosphohydrolase
MAATHAATTLSRAAAKTSRSITASAMAVNSGVCDTKNSRAYLHDTIEDQEVTHAELVEAFDLDVADLVAHVTDDKGLPKDRRKRLQVEHAPHLPPRAQMLKMADKISNLSALLASPPAGWSAQRRTEYFEWAREVVEGCRTAHAGLAGMFDELYGRREHQK